MAVSDLEFSSSLSSLNNKGEQSPQFTAKEQQRRQDALANRIVELYSDPQRRLDMATRAKNTFRIYEWPRMKLRYYNVINSLAKIR